MQEQPSYVAFREFVMQRFPNLLDMVVEEFLASYGERLRQITTPDDFRQRVREVMRGYLNAAEQQDPEAIESWIRQMVGNRVHKGMGLDAVLKSISIYRNHFLHVALDAIAHQVEHAHEATRKLMDVFERVLVNVSKIYGAYLEEYHAELYTFKTLVDNALDGIALSGPENTIIYSNQSFQQMIGDRQAIGLFPARMVTKGERRRLRAIFQQVAAGGWRGELVCQRADGSSFPTEVSLFPIHDQQGKFLGNAGIIRDISEQKQAEKEHRRLQEQIIETQRATLRELSTPLMPLSNHVLAMPIVGAVDQSRAQTIMETLLEGIMHYQAEVAILDITGVRVVDTQVAHALMRTARAARLLGAQVVLTGISPGIAQTLTHVQADLGDIITLGSVQQAIDWVQMQAHTPTPRTKNHERKE